MEDKKYSLADLSFREEEIIKRIQKEIQDEIGKDLVIIAWEQNK